jgi:hypothetical protein
MSQKVFNGFPQYFSYTYQTGKFFGTLATQVQESFTDVDLQSQLIGDSITLEADETGVLSIVRDGAVLLEDQGWELIAPNIVRIFPGLLENETLQFKKLVGTSGVIETIPTIPPVPGTGGYPQTLVEATVYTDAFKPAVNAFEAIVLSSKTRISTQFLLNEGRIDVYINNTRISVNDDIWTLVDNTTIELNDDYSATRMKVDIIRQKVG